MMTSSMRHRELANMIAACCEPEDQEDGTGPAEAGSSRKQMPQRPPIAPPAADNPPASMKTSVAGSVVGSVPKEVDLSRDMEVAAMRAQAARLAETANDEDARLDKQVLPGPAGPGLWSEPHHMDLLVPPLCPDLVLLLSKGRFWISLMDVKRFNNEGTLEISGMTGPILRLQHREDQEQHGHVMELLKTRGENEVLVNAIGQPPPFRTRMYRFIQEIRHEMALEIRRADQSVWGLLIPESQNKFLVICIPPGNASHQTVLTIVVDPVNFVVDVTTGHGTIVAQVKRSDLKVGKLLINVVKGADAGLTLACILAALLPSIGSPKPPRHHHAYDSFAGN